MGTRGREGLEVLRQRFPLLSGAEIREYIGPVNYVHAILGIVIAAVTILAGYTILMKSRNLSGLIRESVWGMIVLIVAQLIVGLVLVVAGLPSLLQLFHLWIASLFIGVIFVLYSAFRRQTGGDHAIGA